MQNPLTIAESRLLVDNSLLQSHLEAALSSMVTARINYADLYFQLTHQESWVLEDGIVKSGSFAIDQGVGVRAISGEKTGFAYSGDINPDGLLQASNAARNIARSGATGQLAVLQRNESLSLYSPENPLKSIEDATKISVLQSLDTLARGLDPRVKQVIASITASHDTILIAATDGTLNADVRPLVRISVSVIVEQNGRREQASAGGGGRFGYQQLFVNDQAENYAKDAVRQALIKLEAVDAPAGAMSVVLGPGWPGILLHEAIGHGLEGDFNRKGTSAFSGMIGQKIATDLCTIVDDGTIDGRRGSLNVDDEGTISQNTVLIEKGVLKGYMQDKMNAGLMGQSSTGNGRRESYAHLPMPRMTNTYMLAGQSDPQEVIASVKKGLYAVNFGGGQVDITSGKFVFSASEAYLIENGKITQPVKGATLIGNGAEVLKRVSMLGNDLQLDAGVGTCGKQGQSVPVGVGQPTMRIDELTVGGTQTG